MAIRAVAFERSSGERELNCGTYVGQTTGRKVTVTIKLHDSRVEVFDRRTAKMVTTRTFPATAQCKTVTWNASDYEVANREAIKAWLKTLLK
jgi:hypothetical protein